MTTNNQTSIASLAKKRRTYNELPVALGNLVGGLALTGLALYTTHVRTAPKREF